MGKGKTGTSTGTIIRVPKVKRTNSRHDYKLSADEKEEVKNKNDISREERRQKAKYNKGFGDIVVKSVDLSKYRDLK